MARCGCGSDCACAVVAGCGVTVTGSGGATAPYTVATKIDPDPSNALSCGPDGLIVSADAAGGVTTADSSCIEFAGLGTEGSPLIATPVINPADLNILSCGPGGLLALDTVSAYGLMLDTGSDPTVLPAAAEGVNADIPCMYDSVATSSNVACLVAGDVARPYTHMEVLTGYNGVYYIEAGRAGWTAGPSAEGDVIFRLTLYVNNNPVATVASPVFTSTAAEFNIPELQVSAMQILSAGANVWVEASVEDYDGAWAGATLGDGIYGSDTNVFSMYRIGGL